MTEAALEATARPDVSRRAQPLSAEARRSMIIDAVLPLLMAHGRQITSRQIAEAAGVAEGTIFRAFGDKESLIAAAIARHLDPEPLREALRAIDPGQPLEEKLRATVALLRERFASMFQAFAVVGRPDRPPARNERHEFEVIVEGILRPELAELNWPVDRIAQVIRLVSFSSSFPPINDGNELSDDELASIILYGIAGVPTAAVASPVRPSASPESASRVSHESRSSTESKE